MILFVTEMLPLIGRTTADTAWSQHESTALMEYFMGKGSFSTCPLCSMDVVRSDTTCDMVSLSIVIVVSVYFLRADDVFDDVVDGCLDFCAIESGGCLNG